MRPKRLCHHPRRRVWRHPPSPPVGGHFCDALGGALADTDGDGLTDCDEALVIGTNPELADTDGDGFSDMAEAAVFDPVADRVTFNPRVSDLARIAIDLTSVPEMSTNATLYTAGEPGCSGEANCR